MATNHLELQSDLGFMGQQQQCRGVKVPYKLTQQVLSSCCHVFTFYYVCRVSLDIYVLPAFQLCITTGVDQRQKKSVKLLVKINGGRWHRPPDCFFCLLTRKMLVRVPILLLFCSLLIKCPPPRGRRVRDAARNMISCYVRKMT